jgi:hypothetical protein
MGSHSRKGDSADAAARNRPKAEGPFDAASSSIRQGAPKWILETRDINALVA